MEKRGRLGSASSSLSLVPPAPLWYSPCGSVVNDGEDPRLGATGIFMFIFWEHSVQPTVWHKVRIKYPDYSALVRGDALHHSQYHSLDPMAHPNRPQTHCHIQVGSQSRTGRMQNMAAAVAVASCNRTVPQIVD
jgi:hypothetical protein